MKFYYTITILFTLLSTFVNAQCFECIKTYGGHADDNIYALEKTSNGFISLVNEENTIFLTKYDAQCNIIWKKPTSAFAIKIDKYDNIYTFRRTSGGYAVKKTISKLDQNGNEIWEIVFALAGYNSTNQSIEFSRDTYLKDFHITDDKIYLIGYFDKMLALNNEIIYDFRQIPNSYNKNFFISEFDLDGNHIDSKIISGSNGNINYITSARDEFENLYLIKYNSSTVDLEKYDSEFNLIYSKTISREIPGSNINPIIPIRIFYSKSSNKILVFSNNLRKTNIGNHTIIYDNDNDNSFNQSMLTSIDANTGEVIDFKKFDFINTFSLHPNDKDINTLSFYFDYTEDEGNAFILTRFHKDIHMNGEVIKPKISILYENHPAPVYDTNLILFKINPDNLHMTPLLSTNTGPKELYSKRDIGRFIKILDQDNILISGNYSSLNFEINNIHIPNQSDNGNTDYFIYKYNLNNQPNNIALNFENTCLGNPTNFSIDGNFDSVVWNFGDGTTSTETNPNHQYNNAGTYDVTALITCNNETREFTKEITITNTIVLSQVDPLEVCEELSSTGIGKFNTLNIPSQLLENRGGIEFKFYTTQNIEIPNFISESYQNTQPYNERIIVKAYYNNNPNCISSSEIQLNVTAKTPDPIIRESLVFCAPNLKQFNEIAIEGENLKFYNEFNQLINPSEIISSGMYYVTASENDKCESNKVELNIEIQQTEAPIINSSQSFCADLNPTIANLNSNGFEIKWYDSVNSTNPLNPDVLLINGKTYYASQINNNCESVNRSLVTVELLNHTIIDSSAIEICKDENTFGEFNLTNKANELAQIYQVNSSQIVFYETLQDALENLNGIGLNYRNTNQTSEIFATIISSEACKTFYKIPLIESINPIIQLSEKYFKCKDDSYSITLDGNYDSIEWSNGSTSQTTEFTHPGTYHVTITNGNCSITKSFEIENYPDLQFEYTYDGTNVTFQFLNDLNTKVSLDQNNWSNQIFQLEPGLYTFYFKSNNGCIEEHSIYLYKDIPTFISPNGDGINDEWNISFVKDLKAVTIIDRFGKQIFHKTKNEQPIKWNGKFNGKTLPSASYWYTINLEDGKIIEGYILIKNK